MKSWQFFTLLACFLVFVLMFAREMKETHAELDHIDAMVTEISNWQHPGPLDY